MTKDPRYEIKRCSICQGDYVGFGNNAQPINDGRCCNDCNGLVIAARLQMARRCAETVNRKRGNNADSN